MYIEQSEIDRMVEKYGRPRELDAGTIAMREAEYDLLIASMKGGRRHDVTLFASKNGKFVCIQKNMYAGTGIYRAPSGGVHRGEAMDDGLLREMFEETGAEVELDHFLLIVHSSFTGPSGDDPVPWTSYVFSGRAISGDMEPRDTEEIHKVRMVSAEELTGEIAEKMLEAGLGGFRYRVMLTKETLRELRLRA